MADITTYFKLWVSELSHGFAQKYQSKSHFKPTPLPNIYPHSSIPTNWVNVYLFEIKAEESRATATVNFLKTITLIFSETSAYSNLQLNWWEICSQTSDICWAQSVESSWCLQRSREANCAAKLQKKISKMTEMANLCKYSLIIMIERAAAVTQSLTPDIFLQYCKLIGI